MRRRRVATINNGRDQRRAAGTEQLPTLSTGESVLFPNIALPFEIGPDSPSMAVDEAISKGRVLAVFARMNLGEDPEPDNLYQVGTAASIARLNRTRDGTLHLTLQGLRRIRRRRWVQQRPFMTAEVETLQEIAEADPEITALTRNLLDLFERAIDLSPSLPTELLTTAKKLTDPGQLADLVASTINLDVVERQDILETLDIADRLRKLNSFTTRELEILELGQRIQDQVSASMERNQREYYLREQLKAIRQELGEADEKEAEVASLRQRLEAAHLPAEAWRETERELERLARLSPSSPEQNVITTYLDWIASLPWSKTTQDILDIERAQQILDEDHYDLEKVKDRILEYLAVSKLRQDLKGPVLAFVGPPGVGKTSLGQSIARSLGRQFVRISLGGIRDEAEIRGHRRTYVGAMPGRIIQGMRRAGTNNPVFMLDEIDKLAVSFQGDPAAALLEVLDPAQNNAFTDLYVGVPFDLSKVIFIATGNMTDTIPSALLDRMEVIRLAGYTDLEKIQIARRFLVPRQIKENGLTPEQVKISDGALATIAHSYTREAGVRNLERDIATVFRRVARRIAEGQRDGVEVEEQDIPDFLGHPRFRGEIAEQKDEIGVATGLAWTSTGGDIMFIEVSVVPGHGKLILTGQLGDVMRESAMAAVTYIRSRAAALGISDDFFDRSDLHIHVPAGAIPKDGPSAGVTMTTALVSALTRHPVAKEVGMTGEITLRGKVLPIGGLREKVLAAHRAGLKTILLPEENKPDLDEVHGPAKQDLNFIFVNHMDQVLSNALRPEQQKEEPQVRLAPNLAEASEKEENKPPSRRRKAG